MVAVRNELGYSAYGSERLRTVRSGRGTKLIRLAVWKVWKQVGGRIIETRPVLDSLCIIGLALGGDIIGSD